jgi:predicted permease
VGGVVSGILIVSAVIAVGYLAARFRILGPEVQGALTRTAFYITNPALLYTVVAGSDIRAALGTDAPLALLSAAAVGLLYWLLSFLFFRRPAAETAVGAMASSYANANNIGIPVSLYAVGTAQHVAPVLLVQLLVLAPFYLTLLGIFGGARISWKKVLLQPLSNPMIIASALGVVVAVTGWTAPDLLQKPIDMLAGGAVPMVLLAFGLSLAGGSAAEGRRPDGDAGGHVPEDRRDAAHCVAARPVCFRAGGPAPARQRDHGGAPHGAERLPVRLPLRPGHERGPRRDPLHHHPVRGNAAGCCVGRWVGKPSRSVPLLDHCGGSARRPHMLK